MPLVQQDFDGFHVSWVEGGVIRERVCRSELAASVLCEAITLGRPCVEAMIPLAMMTPPTMQFQVDSI